MSGDGELRTERLAKAFGGQPVLRGLDLLVPGGRVLAVLGASGSGKTTLLRLLCGFERADAGRVLLGGRVLAGPGVHLAPERRRIGYVAQEGALFPHLTVAENVLFGLPRGERTAARAEALLAAVDLPATYARRGPHQLSGGEQQRVALARALAPGPPLVLLDEPFSALDAALRVETRQAVARSLAAAGATAVLVTHDQPEALSMGDQVAVLRQGALAQVDTPEAIYRRPVDAALAAFLGEAILLPGEAAGGAVRCALGVLACGGSGAVDVLVRPEQIRLGADGVAASVTALRFQGADARVELRLTDGTVLAALAPGHRVPALGDTVRVSVDGGVVAFPRRRYVDGTVMKP